MVNINCKISKRIKFDILFTRSLTLQKGNQRNSVMDNNMKTFPTKDIADNFLYPDWTMALGNAGKLYNGINQTMGTKLSRQNDSKAVDSCSRRNSQVLVTEVIIKMAFVQLLIMPNYVLSLL